MKNNKGQSLVEFALVIPFFLLLVFGIIYSGMLFHDYSTLSNLARSAGREAAIVSGTQYDEIEAFYLNQSKNMLTTLYTTEEVSVKPETQTDGSAGVYIWYGP